MKKLLLYFSGALFLVGCSLPNQTLLDSFTSNSLDYKQKLIKTQKAILYKDNQTKAILTATYSNGFDDINGTDERFIITLYIDNSDTNRWDNRYHITLNGKKPKSITKLKSDDKLLSNISFKNGWKNYFLVKFPHVSSQQMYMIFGDNRQDIKLYFAKKAKYLYK
jgi:hypothetical protein